MRVAGITDQKGLFTRGSMFGDVARTSAVGIVVMLMTVVAQGIAARIWSSDPDSLSLYLLIRKINLALVPMVIAGMSMALSRYMPMYAEYGSTGRRKLLTVTFSTVAISAAVYFSVLIVFRQYFAGLLFDDPELAYLIRSLVLFSGASILLTQVNAYFQGRMWMKVVNLAQFIAAGLVQVAVLTMASDAGVARIIEYIGLGIMAVGVVFLLLALKDSVGRDPGTAGALKETTAETARKMLGYGIPRVPSFLAMSGLWLVSPVLVVKFGELGKAAYMITALNLLNFIAVPFRPMTVVFLPRFSEMKAQGRLGEISKLTSLLGTMLIQLGILGTTQLAIFIPALLRGWMEFTDPEAYILATIIVLAIPAYLVFEVLRNPIDSFTVFPVNTFTIGGALALLCLTSWLLSKAVEPTIAVAWGTTIAFAALGAATWIVANRLMVKPGEGQGGGWLVTLVSVVVLGGIGWAIRSAIAGVSGGIALAIVAVWALLVTGLYVFAQLRAGTPWAVELKQRITRKG